MMKSMIAALVVLGSASLPATANDDLIVARSELDAGKYAEAISIATGTNVPDGYALAARAKLIAIDLLDRRDRSMEEVETAYALANEALSVDPDHVEGHLQASGAIGLKSRIVGKIRSHMRGYATDAKVHLDKALELEPDNPWALLYSGIWHVEIVARGGETMARSSYGASVEQGFEILDRAIALRPEHSHFRYFYASNLIVLDSKKYRTQILEHLEKAVESEPVTDYDHVIRERSTDLRELIASGENKKAKRAVDVYFGLKSGK